MKRFKCVLPVSSAILMIASSAEAQIQNPVVSDSTGNTAMGTGALTTIENPYCDGWLDSDACENTAAGSYTIHNLTTGSFNTALGYAALLTNSSGNFNTASGYKALVSNSSGEGNTATGYYSLIANSTGSENTATGMFALNNNNTGNNNTATGRGALYYNSSGNLNTATGMDALAANTTGANNSAFGSYALYGSSTGVQNVAVGMDALYSSTTGNFNTATGYQTLYSNKSGTENTGSGYHALYYSTGTNNIGEGYRAGINLTSGSNNIDIGNVGVAAESSTIRIGTESTQTRTFVAGIYGVSVSGNAVVVDSSGQLGVVSSSERFKTAIAPMRSASDKLDQLRPVTFHLKADPKGNLQYGLIAEEVAKVYPDLVIRNESGRIDGVRYDELAPMLLKRAQDQSAVVARLKTELNQQHAEMAAYQQESHQRESSMEAQLAMVMKQYEAIQEAMLKIQSATRQVAMR